MWNRLIEKCLEFFRKKKLEEPTVLETLEEKNSESKEDLEEEEIVIEERIVSIDPLVEALEALELKGQEFAKKYPTSLLDDRMLADVHQQLLNYQIFGANVFSIPCALFRKCNDKEYPFSIPFRFFNPEKHPDYQMNEWEVFKRNYEGILLPNFILLGYLGDDIVVLNENNQMVTSFHPSDNTDPSFLEYRLKQNICSLIDLINQLKKQTVCCYVIPDSGLYFRRFEIQGEMLMYEVDILTSSGQYGKDLYPSLETCEKAYNQLVNQAVEDGYVLSFGPQYLQ